MNIDQRGQQIDQHRVLRSLGDRDVKLPVKNPAIAVIAAVTALRDQAPREFPSRLSWCARSAARRDDLALQQSARLPKIADADPLHRQREQRRIVDQRHPAERPDDRAAAMGRRRGR